MAALQPDQVELWNKKHGREDHASFRARAMPFAYNAAANFTPHAHILEIGCGTGADAAYFSEQGHNVLATDVSSVVVAQNKEHYKGLTTEFRQLDAAKSLPFQTGQFDSVYSHLALHYFTDAATKSIFREISRVLRPHGIFAFACKSVNDSLYGKGEEIESDMFIREGHIRHFFSSNYAKELLGDTYDIIELNEVQEEYAGHTSSMIHCIARKRAK